MDEKDIGDILLDIQSLINDINGKQLMRSEIRIRLLKIRDDCVLIEKE